MTDIKNIEYILEGISNNLSKINNELVFMRKIFEREEQSKAMILQKVNNENDYSRLQ